MRKRKGKRGQKETEKNGKRMRKNKMAQGGNRKWRKKYRKETRYRKYVHIGGKYIMQTLLAGS
jgi:hypothetical protein